MAAVKPCLEPINRVRPTGSSYALIPSYLQRYHHNNTYALIPLTNAFSGQCTQSAPERTLDLTMDANLNNIKRGRIAAGRLHIRTNLKVNNTNSAKVAGTTSSNRASLFVNEHINV